MEDFKKIYLTWRPGGGSRRFLVGLLEKKATGDYIFNYLPAAKKLILEESFSPYFEFQDLDKIYDNNVVEIFASRLMKADRTDINKLYEFWDVDLAKANDKFYLLGKTQGLVATDNFEFLAEYNVHKDLKFVTEIAGISKYTPLPKGTIEIGDKLRFETEPKNLYDPEAVKVFKGDLELGYIKKVHCKTFYHPDAQHLNLSVKGLEQNGVIKKMFIDVQYV
jgi:hypothetical protein